MPERYPITLVTAYFALGREQAKYAGNPYPGWIRNFLSVVRWPLVIFCDEQSVDMLRQARGDRPAVYHVTRLQDFLVYRYLDTIQRYISGIGLSAEYGLIQYEKHSFLRQALSENPFGSEMLFWCDIGMFRPMQPGIRWCLPDGFEWPNLRVCRALPQDKAVIWVRNQQGLPSGIFFGGAVDPLRRWCDAFYPCLEQEARAGAMHYTEEHIMQVLWSRHPQFAHGVLANAEAPWLRFVNFLAGLSGREVQGHKWYFMSGRKFPWRYLCGRLFSRSGR